MKRLLASLLVGGLFALGCGPASDNGTGTSNNHGVNTPGPSSPTPSTPPAGTAAPTPAGSR